MVKIKISKRKRFGLELLIIASFFHLICCISEQYTIMTYVALLVLLTTAVMYINELELVSANVIFMAFFLYTVALGPLILMSRNIYYSYNYQNVILGGFLCFGWGNFVLAITTKNVFPRRDVSSIKFYIMSRKNVLSIAYIISLMAGICYFGINRDLLRANLEGNRTAALSGNGIIIYTMELPIVIIPMVYDLYFESKKLGKPQVSCRTLVVMAIVSSFVLLFTGYRAPIMTMYICLIIMYAKKNNISGSKVVRYGIICMLAVFILGAGRTLISGGGFAGAASFMTNFYVNNINLKYVFNTFPEKVPFQHGYTYLINLLMMLPGPDPDFTLWLKEQIGISFSGGGVTPTIMGEIYINFGFGAIFFGMFAFGMFGVIVNKYAHRNNYSFMAAYYIWQYAHCASGGIANVMVPVILYTVVYKVILMLPAGKLDALGGTYGFG